jgi:hypothetical protein
MVEAPPDSGAHRRLAIIIIVSDTAMYALIN